MRNDIHSDLTPEVREKMKKNLVYISIISICMLFAGLTSAYYVSMGDSFWVKTKLPTPFWISTALILLSSLTFILAIASAQKGNQTGLKLFITLTFLLGVGFAYFQVKGYKALTKQGMHFAGGNIFVMHGKYGDYFRLKYKGNYLEVDGNDYFLEGKLISEEDKAAISQFAKQFENADSKDGLSNVTNYGTDFLLLFKNSPLTLENGKFVKSNGEDLELLNLTRLKEMSWHLRDGRGDFFVKGTLGKDFDILYKGDELSYKNRVLHRGEKPLTAYEKNDALRSWNAASTYLYLITIVHLLHIVFTLLFMIKTLRYSYSGKYTQDDTIGLRVTGIFWHFLGLLWIYLLLFLLFIH